MPWDAFRQLCSEHPVKRQKAAQALAGSLICEVLGRMDNRGGDSHLPTEPLVASLEDADKSVRRAASHGLTLLKWEPRDAREQGLQSAI